ncbi:hypothetical protein PMZ80_005175 [Knufia obscura]|uniref:AB hydrolase-1 domain-containing protein n=2 Tax=Knufia TaxID=430999 RepID=A0AAN8EL75_9EURO|nr:hypothetical protein PMZ80_005175 [Knufia obscura]KAK5957843.1 hypothetical protein OHC33_001032 [Knufia fluminis]
MTPTTTIIFVPDAWHGPECFDKVASTLRTQDYKTDYVHLPSVDPQPTPLKSFDPDVETFRTHIQSAADAAQQIILVMHSYGSIPTCQAVQNLEYTTRQAQNLPGGVTHLFFMAAFIIPAGKILIEAFGGNDLPW